MKHTRGPWEAEHEQCDPRPSPDDPGFFIIEGPILDRHGPIADTMNRDHCISPEEDRANARLIAAAPDLLEALTATKFYVETLEKHLSDGDESADKIRAHADMIRAAIAKATK